MKKMYMLLYLLFLLFATISYSYSGQTTTNIYVNITNSSVIVWNEKLINTLNISITNQTNISWNADFEYNSTNIIIYNYTIQQNCSLLEEKLEEIKSNINNNSQIYYLKYLDCFSNLTTCDAYRTTNEGCNTNLLNCNSISLDHQNKNVKLTGDYYVLNQTYWKVVEEKDNYAGQRFIWFIIGGLVVFVVTFFLLKGYPNMMKHGKSSASKLTSPPTDSFNPEEVKSKEEREAEKK